MRPAGSAQNIMSCIHIAYPVTESFIYGILQYPGSFSNRYHFGAKSIHPENIGTLPLNINLSHIYGAFKSKFRSHCCSCHAMLSGTSLCNDPGLSHSLYQKPLPHNVICLMGTCMIQILTLYVDTRAIKMICKVFGKSNWRRPAGIR